MIPSLHIYQLNNIIAMAGCRQSYQNMCYMDAEIHIIKRAFCNFNLPSIALVYTQFSTELGQVMNLFNFENFAPDFRYAKKKKKKSTQQHSAE